MMKMHGLEDSSYWIISYAWCLTLCLLFFSMLWAIGALCGLTMFVQTQWSLQVVCHQRFLRHTQVISPSFVHQVLYLLWSNNMVCTAIFLSSVFSTAAAATSFVLIYIFFSGILGFQLFEYYFPASPPWLHAVQIVPSFALFRALYEITQRAALTTLQGAAKHQFAQRWDNIQWEQLGAPLLAMAVQAVVLLAAGLIVDHVRFGCFLSTRSVHGLNPKIHTNV